MKKYLKLLHENELFNNLTMGDLESVLFCLAATVSEYNKNDIIMSQGSKINRIGIILSGGVQVIKEDIDGNINILSHLGENDIFAETFAYAEIEESPVTVQAVENCEIMFLDSKSIIKICKNNCDFYLVLIENMLQLMAGKNLILNQKMQILSKRTIREKLLEFFSIQSQMNHSRKFSIPYNRDELAFFLSVDRSSLSRELGKMRDEELIIFSRNNFEIL